MLEKIPDKPILDKLPVIHIFEADQNAWTGIVFGRRMMHKAERLGALGEEQGGSRKGRTAVDVYAMKAISFQMAELTKTPLAVMDNDAKHVMTELSWLSHFYDANNWASYTTHANSSHTSSRLRSTTYPRH